MEKLIQRFQALLAATDTSFLRYSYQLIDWNDRMTAIIGARGIGKTTLLLQHIKLNLSPKETLYVSADDFYFAEHRLLDFAEEFHKMGGKYLFVDEIHRLSRQVEEVLYPAMEDFEIDIMIGKGATARSIRLDLPKFTLVGATTRVGLLTAPLRDRFGVVHKLDFYTTNELVQVLERSANVLDVTLEKEGALELARRSRGTPRLANRLLKRVRDFAQVRYDSVITKEVAEYALDLLEVDRLGLDKGDRAILETIADKFGGGPVGLDTIAAALGEDSGTIEDVYEPYLIQNGLIERTPRGRAITRLAYEHLHRPVPKV